MTPQQFLLTQCGRQNPAVVSFLVWMSTRAFCLCQTTRWLDISWIRRRRTCSSFSYFPFSLTFELRETGKIVKHYPSIWWLSDQPQSPCCKVLYCHFCDRDNDRETCKFEKLSWIPKRVHVSNISTFAKWSRESAKREEGLLRTTDTQPVTRTRAHSRPSCMWSR